MDKVIELREMSVAIAGHRILDGVDLELRAGEATSIIGPNGSGKTTLLRVIATLVRPTAGTARVLGADLTGPVDRSIRPLIGLVSHTPGLLDELSLAENLAHFARVTARDPADCGRALAAVGLARATSRRASEASFGMMRRAEIAWLLVAKPRVLLLDEARSGLDRDARGLIDELSRLTLGRGGSVISVSHEESSLGPAGGPVHHLADGRLVAS